MAIAHNNSSNGGTTGATSFSWSHTCSGSNRYLRVGVSIAHATATVSAVTYNGVALSFLDGATVPAAGGGPVRGEYWYLVAPPVGTFTILVTLTASAAAAGGASSHTDVHQTTFHGTAAKATGNSATATVAVSSVSGDLVVDCLALRTGATGITVGAGQASRWNRLANGTPPTGTLPTGAGSEEVAVSTSVTMSWTVNDATSKAWVTVAVALKTAGTGFTATINGTDRTSLLRGREMRITRRLGSRSTCEIVTKDRTRTSPVRPDVNQVLTVVKDSTTIFAGKIIDVSDAAFSRDAYGAVDSISAIDYSAVVEQRIVSNYTVPEGTTLNVVISQLVLSYLTVYGISHFMPVTGPALSAATFDNVTVGAVFNHLSEVTGWIWYVTPAKELKWVSVGTDTCPFSITTANGYVRGKPTWSKSRGKYVNRVYVVCGTTQPVLKTWSVTGNGVQTVFPLDYTPLFNFSGDVVSQGVITENVNTYYAFYHPLTPWTYDSGTNSLVRSPALPNGDTATWNYAVQFPITVSAESSGAATDPWDEIVSAPTCFDKTEGEAIADGLLRRYESAPKVVTVSTRQAGADVGQQITLTMSERDVSGTYLITEIVTTCLDGSDDLLYTLTCLEGNEYQAGWIDYFKSIGRSGGSTTSGSLGVISGDALPSISGLFSSDLIAHSGENSATDGAEISLRGMIPGLASRQGPGILFGRPDDDHAWSISADHLSGGPTTRSLLFTPESQKTNVFPWAMALVEDPSNPEEYYLIPSVNQTLGIGAPASVMGITGYGVASVLCKGEIYAESGFRERSQVQRMGEWVSISTTWGNTGTANAIGNGSLTAKAMRVGKTIRVQIFLTWGSTTTSGSGAWTFLLPSTAVALVSGLEGCGNATLYDNGTGVYGGTIAKFTTTTVVIYHTNAVSNGVGGTVPFTWTTNDTLAMDFEYVEA